MAAKKTTPARKAAPKTGKGDGHMMPDMPPKDMPRKPMMGKDMPPKGMGGGKPMAKGDMPKKAATPKRRGKGK